MKILTKLFVVLILTTGYTIGQVIPNKDMWVTDGPVNCIAVDGNHTYIGGSFTHVSPNTGSGAKLTTTSHVPNLSFPKISGGSIFAAAPDGSGGWYIGGNFTKVGTFDRNRIAHVNSDGTVDAAWNPNASNIVNTIAVSGNDIYVGGNFGGTLIGGQIRNFIAKLNNTNGNADPAWNPGANGSVNTIVISGSDIYVGGSFTTIGGQSRNRLAKLNSTNGTVDATWDPNANFPVNTIAISGSDIYVGGSFSGSNSIGGQTRNRIAKLNNTNGNADAAWDPNANSSVSTIAISGSDIYVGGGFSGTIGGQSRFGIAKLNNTDGTADATWNANTFTSVNAIAISGSDIYVGGPFGTIGGQPRNFIAKLNNTDGTADATWNPNANFTVNTIAISGSDIYVGGDFTLIGRQPRRNIVKLNNINGVVDATWNPNANGQVSAIAINGSDIYVGGAFGEIGGQTRIRIAKLNNTNGTADATWNPNASDQVLTIAINGSDIYVGGSFTTIGGQTRNRIAKLNNTNGNADATWDPNANDLVNSIAISGSDIYVGGFFSGNNSIGGQLRNRVAKLNNTNGNADATWDPNASDRVTAIAISGSDIYVGGFFTTIGGQPRNRIAKLNNTNGNADGTWNPGNVNGQVNAIAFSGSDIYIGGNFAGSLIGGQARNFIAKLNNTNGDADPTWNPQPGQQVQAIAISGGDIYAGGQFLSMGGSNQPFFALFTDRILPVELSSFSALIIGSTVKLNWTTTTEINNYGFEVERFTQSAERQAWNKIGFIPGNGNSNSPKDYSFVDNKLIGRGKYLYRLKQIDNDGVYEYSNVIEVNLGHPAAFSLAQNYPNPFNPSTKIRYSIPNVGSGLVQTVLKVYDVIGNEVATLVNGYKPAGSYEVTFDASSLSSGIYLYKIQSGDFVQTKKMLLLR